MVLQRLFKERPAEGAGKALYASAVAQARTPAFYARLGAPDTPEGRFELYTLHVVLLLRRLKGNGEQAAETGQGLMDAYMASLDLALRELGAGDLSMAKKMKKLGQAFYGRVRAYEAAFAALPDQSELFDLVRRTMGAEALAEDLVGYAAAAESVLAATPLQSLLEGRAAWPEVA